MKTIDDVFRVNGTFYSYGFDADDDSTFLKQGINMLYTINVDAVMHDKDGVRIGQFLTDANSLWFFRPEAGEDIHTGNKSLLKAEVKIFKQLLEAA